MRVIIDFEPARPGQWAGVLHDLSTGAEPRRFEGRLQLLRWLEELVDRTAHTPQNEGPPS